MALTGLIQRVDASALYHMACRMDRGHNFWYNGWQAIRDYLEYNTSVVCCEDDCIIWQAF